MELRRNRACDGCGCPSPSWRAGLHRRTSPTSTAPVLAAEAADAGPANGAGRSSGPARLGRRRAARDPRPCCAPSRTRQTLRSPRFSFVASVGPGHRSSSTAAPTARSPGLDHRQPVRVHRRRRLRLRQHAGFVSANRAGIFHLCSTKRRADHVPRAFVRLLARKSTFWTAARKGTLAVP